MSDKTTVDPRKKAVQHCFIPHFRSGDHEAMSKCFSTDAVIRGSMAKESHVPHYKYDSHTSQDVARTYFKEFLGEHGRDVRICDDGCFIEYHDNNSHTVDVLAQVSRKCDEDRRCGEDSLVRLTFQVDEAGKIKHLHGSNSNINENTSTKEVMVFGDRILEDTSTKEANVTQIDPLDEVFSDCTRGICA